MTKGASKEKEKAPLVKPYVPPIPYPSRVIRNNFDDKFTKFLDMMKGLRVEMPFLQAMAQMPLYMKFLKKALTSKALLEEMDEIPMSLQVSSIIQGKMPKKEVDPGSYILPVKIANLKTMGALADLGAGPSVIPFSIAKKLPYEIFPTKRTIQLADRSIVRPKGQLLDIPIMVGHLLVPCDFYVMEMDEDPHTPLILGRAALKTLSAVINCRKDTITIEAANEKVEFGFSNIAHQPMIERVCGANVIASDLEELKGAPDNKGGLYDTLVGNMYKAREKAKGTPKVVQEEPTCKPLKVFKVKEESSTPPPKVTPKSPPPSIKYVHVLDDERHAQYMEKFEALARRVDDIAMMVSMNHQSDATPSFTSPYLDYLYDPPPFDDDYYGFDDFYPTYDTPPYDGGGGYGWGY